MTHQSDLISALFQRVNRPDRKDADLAKIITKGEIKRLLIAFSDVVADDLVSSAGDSGEVNLAGLGRWRVVTRAASAGCNPATGERIAIPARRSIKFSVAPALKKRMAATPASSSEYSELTS
jgi:DNA-binding protein HU-beta